jgi:hypothetical protein
MATWRDFIAYVKSNYDVTYEEPGMLQLVFATTEGRSQTVQLSRRRLLNGSEEWLVIDSPFAEAEDVKVERALEAAGHMTCGGIVSVDGTLYYRHAVPLVNLDSNEFKRPLRLVTMSADHLEQRLLGEDNY